MTVLMIDVGDDVIMAGEEWHVVEVFHWKKEVIGYRVERNACKPRNVAIGLVQKINYPPTYTF